MTVQFRSFPYLVTDAGNEIAGFIYLTDACNFVDMHPSATLEVVRANDRLVTYKSLLLRKNEEQGD